MVQEPTKVTDAQHHEHIDCTFCRQQVESCEATIRDLRLDVEHKQMHIEALASDVTLLGRLEQELAAKERLAQASRESWDAFKEEANREREARVQAEQERERLTLEMETWKHGLRDFYTSRLAEVEQRLDETLEAWEKDNQ
jgi:chromosome segregation ATPase